MRREEVRRVIGAFYDRDGSVYARDRRDLVVAPFETVQEIVKHEKLEWTQEEIRLVAAVLAHESSVQTIELMETILSSEDMIRDIINTARPASNSALVMQVCTLTLGVGLTVAAVIAALQGQTLLGSLLGGLGISSFLYLFFREPIKGVQRGISNLIQLEVIYNGYVKQLAYWRAYERTRDLLLKPAILAEIEGCTNHTMYLIQRYTERGQRLPRAPLSIKPREFAFEPSSSPQPKPFADKMMVMDKMPTMDGAADETAASSAQPHGAPPLMFYPKTKEIDGPPFDLGQVPDEGEAPPTPDQDSSAAASTPGPGPFVLATEHQAPTWKEHDLAVIEKALEECRTAIAARERDVAELLTIAQARSLTSEEDRCLASLRKEHEDLSAKYEELVASKNALM
jgi:hypothetical protein